MSLVPKDDEKLWYYFYVAGIFIFLNFHFLNFTSCTIFKLKKMKKEKCHTLICNSKKTTKLAIRNIQIIKYHVLRV